MKKAVTASLFVFWMVVTAVLAAGLINYDKSKSGGGSAPTQAVTDSGAVKGGASNSGVAAAKLVLSMAELAKHNSAQSCWLLVSGKIYDVTNFINLHPGNAQTILSSCGQDATRAYATMDGRGKSHSGTANAMLVEYYIGDLNQSLNLGNVSGGAAGATNSNVLPAPQPKTIPPRGDDGDDDD